MTRTVKIVLLTLAAFLILLIAGCAIFGAGSEQPGDVSAIRALD